MEYIYTGGNSGGKVPVAVFLKSATDFRQQWFKTTVK